MDGNPEVEASGEQWRCIDDTIVLVGLLLFQELVIRSGYDSDTIVELQDRVRGLVKEWSRKGL